MMPPGQQYPGQQYPGQQYPGQQFPPHQFAGQPFPGQQQFPSNPLQMGQMPPAGTLPPQQMGFIGGAPQFQGQHHPY
jgi:hypothetical protein